MNLSVRKKTLHTIRVINNTKMFFIPYRIYSHSSRPLWKWLIGEQISIMFESIEEIVGIAPELGQT